MFSKNINLSAIVPRYVNYNANKAQIPYNACYKISKLIIEL